MLLTIAYVTKLLRFGGGDAHLTGMLLLFVLQTKTKEKQTLVCHPISIGLDDEIFERKNANIVLSSILTYVCFSKEPTTYVLVKIKENYFSIMHTYLEA